MKTPGLDYFGISLYWIKVIHPLPSESAFAFCSNVDLLLEIFIFNLLQLRSKNRGQRAMKVTLVRGYNLESLWLCLLQNKVEELNQRLRQVIDGNSFPFSLECFSDAEQLFDVQLTVSCYGSF